MPALDLWTPNLLSRDGKLAIGRFKANDKDVLRFRIVEVDTNKTVRDGELRLLATLRSQAITSGAKLDVPGLADEVKLAGELLRDFPLASTTLAASGDGKHVAVQHLGSHRVYTLRDDHVIAHDLSEPQTFVASPLFTDRAYLFSKATMSTERTLYATSLDGATQPTALPDTAGIGERFVVANDKTARILLHANDQVCAADLALAKPYKLTKRGCLPGGFCVQSPNGNWFACEHQGQSRTWNVAAGKPGVDNKSDQRATPIAINDEGLVVLRGGGKLDTLAQDGTRKQLASTPATLMWFAAFRSSTQLVVHLAPEILVVLDLMKQP